MRREMRRWSESRAIVITLAFFVGQPMNTGRRKSSVCQPSCQAGKMSVLKPSGATTMLVCKGKKLKYRGHKFWDDLGRTRDISVAHVSDRDHFRLVRISKSSNWLELEILAHQCQHANPWTVDRGPWTAFASHVTGTFLLLRPLRHHDNAKRFHSHLINVNEACCTHIYDPIHKFKPRSSPMANRPPLVQTPTIRWRM